MKRPVLTLMGIVTTLFVAFVAMGQVLPNLPQNTVWGRLGIGTGPGQAIPFSTLAGQITSSSSSAANTVQCNPTASPANAQACTVAQTKALLTLEVSVTDPAFGAKCDGATDDTTAIQAAINSLPSSGGIVLFPAATCRISSTLTIGNGTTSAFSTRTGVYLIGRGIPNSVNFFGGYPASNGPKLQWLGASAVPMISLLGPLQGWGVQNLFLDCGSVATDGLLVTSASYGDSKNLTMLNCTSAGLFSTSHPLGAYTGTNHVDSLRNTYTNLFVLTPTTSASKGVVFQGAADATSNTDYNTVTNLIIGFASVNAQVGIYLGVADSNVFINTSIAGMSGSQNGILLDYSINSTFPLSNIFFGLEDQGGTPYAVNGSPGAGSKNNYVIGPVEGNGGTAPNNIAGFASPVMSKSGNLATWLTYTPALSCGTATFTVNSARFTTMNKSTQAQLDFTISSLGTCTNSITFNLPVTAASSGGMAGRNEANDFIPVNCAVFSSGTSTNCSKTTLANFAGSDRILLSGTYESQ